MVDADTRQDPRVEIAAQVLADDRQHNRQMPTRPLAELHPEIAEEWRDLAGRMLAAVDALSEETTADTVAAVGESVKKFGGRIYQYQREPVSEETTAVRYDELVIIDDPPGKPRISVSEETPQAEVDPLREALEKFATMGHESWKTDGHPMNDWVSREAVNTRARDALAAVPSVRYEPAPHDEDSTCPGTTKCEVSGCRHCCFCGRALFVESPKEQK